MPLFSVARDIISPINTTHSNAWISYDNHYGVVRIKDMKSKYRELMAGYLESIPAGVCKVDFQMAFYYNIDDAGEAGKWTLSQLEKHFIMDKEEMAFSSEW